MMSPSTRKKMTRPRTPVILNRVSMRSAFGEPPFSGENVSASAGAAMASEVRAATAAANRLSVRFERKAGATIRGTGLGPREGRLPLLDESRHTLAHVICAHQRMLDVGFELELRVQVPVDHPVDRLLRARIRERRPAREPLRQ